MKHVLCVPLKFCVVALKQDPYDCEMPPTTLHLYLSAARELRFERETIARAVSEVPTSLGWSIKGTPPPSRESDLTAVAHADAHVLLLGRDIQAPVGLEWAAARRAGRTPYLFAQDTAHTQAAGAFMREVSRSGAWLAFKTAHDLREQVLRLLGDQLLARADALALNDKERERLRVWRTGITDKALPDARADEDASGLILSTERYEPSNGTLLRAKR
jgi:hypothetical protein